MILTKILNKININTQRNKKVKLSGKHEEDMKILLSKINKDPLHYRTMFSGPVAYSEDL